ncbi:MAG: phosphotransferase enzyme family protein [Armatimonadota bacterium]
MMTTSHFEQALLATGTTLLPIFAEDHRLLLDVLSHFDGAPACTLADSEAVRIIAGHINATYCLQHTPSGERFIIQRINTIFDIAAIDNNLQWLEQAQALSEADLPAWWQPVSYLDVPGAGKIFYDESGAGWRVMRFIPGDIKIFNRFSEVPEEGRAGVARSLGETIAVFGHMLEAVPESVWREPLPNFHNAQYHLDYLRAILRGEEVTLSLSRDSSRKVSLKKHFLHKYAVRVADLLARVEARAGLVTATAHLGSIVAHGDTKFNNVVFRPDEGGTLHGICLIDLDTVQLGNILDDLGDALRYAGNPAGEEPPHIDDVQIDEEIVREIIAGYLAKMQEYCTPERLADLAEYAVASFKVFLYSQCLRFLADALAGNEYWKLKPGLPEDINL